MSEQPPTWAFDTATAVQLLAGSPGDGEATASFEAFVDEGWSIMGTPNGGYLLAIAARAALQLAPPEHPHAVAVSVTYVTRVPFGTLAVRAHRLRSGRTTTVVKVTLGDAENPCVEVLVTAAALGADAPIVPGPPVPSMPPIDTCFVLQPEAGPMNVPIFGQIHEAFDPSTLGFGLGNPSGAGELRTYLQFADGRPVDTLALVAMGDVLPPSTFDVPGLALGWVPTLQLTNFVRAVPAPGPLVARALARSVGAGMVDETCDIWDSTGRHVAVTHQLAAVRSA